MPFSYDGFFIYFFRELKLIMAKLIKNSNLPPQLFAYGTCGGGQRRGNWVRIEIQVSRKEFQTHIFKLD